MDHFLTHMVHLVSPTEITLGESGCCGCCPYHTTGENSLRDKVSNRLGSLFGYQVMYGDIALDRAKIELWLNDWMVLNDP
jgi:hypothetical protein